MRLQQLRANNNKQKTYSTVVLDAVGPEFGGRKACSQSDRDTTQQHLSDTDDATSCVIDWQWDVEYIVGTKAAVEGNSVGHKHIPGKSDYGCLQRQTF